MAAKKAPARKKKANPSAWSDADYAAAGFESIFLRPPIGFRDALQALADGRGVTRTVAVVQAVEEALAADRKRK